MDEILEMTRKIDYYNLVYKLKGPAKAISFTKITGPMYTKKITQQKAKKHYDKQKRARRFQKRFKRNNIRESKT